MHIHVSILPHPGCLVILFKFSFLSSSYCFPHPPELDLLTPGTSASVSLSTLQHRSPGSIMVKLGTQKGREGRNWVRLGWHVTQ